MRGVVLYFRSCTRFGVCIILHKCCRWVGSVVGGCVVGVLVCLELVIYLINCVSFCEV